MSRHSDGWIWLGLSGMATIFAVSITACAGWVSNIVQVAQMASADQITAFFIVKCVGIVVAPLGSILGVYGWF